MKSKIALGLLALSLVACRSYLPEGVEGEITLCPGTVVAKGVNDLAFAPKEIKFYAGPDHLTEVMVQSVEKGEGVLYSANPIFIGPPVPINKTYELDESGVFRGEINEDFLSYRVFYIGDEFNTRRGVCFRYPSERR